MRLVCPNCGARYEVPEENIPASGRDVQCSACYTTWFQTHPDATASHDASSDGIDHGRVQPSEAGWAELTTETIVERAVPPALPDDASHLESAAEDTQAPKDLNDMSTKRRLHPTVAEVLREEARREAEVRAAETLETQTRLGLDETTQSVVPKPNAEENGNASGTSKDDAMSQSDTKTLEKELDQRSNENKSVKQQTPIIENQDDVRPSNSGHLPNIDDINSAIDFDKEALVEEVVEETALVDVSLKKTGWLGFVIGLSIIVGSFMIYQYEDRITAAYGPLAPAMSEYVSFVDRMRTYSDRSLYDVVTWLEFQAERARQGEPQE